jgi:hypothetical protein
MARFEFVVPPCGSIVVVVRPHQPSQLRLTASHTNITPNPGPNTWFANSFALAALCFLTPTQGQEQW